MPLTYKAEYTCPSCGLGTMVSNPFEDEIPIPPPVLICPGCGKTTFRTDKLERFYIQTFHEYKSAALGIIRKRMNESEEYAKKYPKKEEGEGEI